MLLVGRWAVKLPSGRGGTLGGLRGRLQSFAWGVLANLSEYEWHDYQPWAGKVAPVARSYLFGLVQVYPRCEPLPVTAGGDHETVLLPTLDPDPGDHKAANYGRLGGRVVRVDYDMR